MISILLNWSGDWSLIDKEVTPYNTHTVISEMVENSYLVLLDEPNQLDLLELAMEEQTDVFIIGAFNMDGTKYLYGNGVRDYSITKYTGKLKNKITYDENGDVLTDEPYTEIEALDVQVNLIAGHPNRTL